MSKLIILIAAGLLARSRSRLRSLQRPSSSSSHHNRSQALEASVPPKQSEARRGKTPMTDEEAMLQLI